MLDETKRHRVDLAFLLFLIGATYVKLYIKLAVVLVYLFYSLVKGYKYKKPESIHLFYILMPVVGFAGAYLHGSFSESNYMTAFLFGSMYWILAATISYFCYITVLNKSKETLHKTIKAFIGINAIVSIGELVKMMIDSGHIMPYWHWGPNMYYGGATGDHVLGITGNISVTNAMICALGALYFIYTKELRWVLLCIFISMLCTSNLTLIFSIAVLALVIIFIRNAKVRSYAFFSLLLSSILYPILTYDNIEYVGTVYTEDIKYKDYSEDELATIKKITSIEWKEDEKYEVTAEIFKQPNNNYYKTRLEDTFSIGYKNNLQYIKKYEKVKHDKETGIIPTGEIHKLIEDWYDVKHNNLALSTYHYPIKLYTHMQTVDYLLSGKKQLLFGAGTGNFSSKQAIKTTGLGLQGRYRTEDIYASKPFLEYHMYSLLYVLGLPASEHSIINMPNSIYNQIGGEYGLVGLLLFLFLYLGYYYKKRKQLDLKSFFLVLLMLLFFNFEYWFEMVSLTVFFELLLFIRIYHKSYER